MNATTPVVAILSVAGLTTTLAVFSGAAAFGIGAFLYLTHRTVVLRHYLTFLVSVFLFVLSFWFREIGTAISRIAAGSPTTGDATSTVVWNLGRASFLSEATGGVLMVLTLPRLSHGIFSRSVSNMRVTLSMLTAVSMIGLAITTIASPVWWAPVVLGLLLYGSVAVAIVEMAVWIHQTKPATTDTSESSIPPAVAATRALRRFLLVSSVFLPLFILDVVISSTDAAWTLHAGVRAIDNLSVPLYFMVLVVGSVAYAYRFMNEPALMVDERVSDFGRERYGLTEREVEVVEFIMEGFSVADAATAMKISPKTVENHLYSVYQKSGVSNRIQLYNLFENRRRL